MYSFTRVLSLLQRCSFTSIAKLLLDVLFVASMTFPPFFLSFVSLFNLFVVH